MIKKKCVRLKSGLTLILVSDNSMHSTRAEIWINFGGKSDNYIIKNKRYSVKPGLAHLLEHSIIEHSPSGNFIDYCYNNHIQANGYTNNVSTRFFIDVISNFDKHFAVLLSMINKFSMTEEDLEKVKKPVIEEIRAKQANIYKEFEDKTTENMFCNSSYIDTLGTVDNINSITIEDLKEAYKVFYQECNQIITVTGNFKIKEILEFIKSYYSKLKKRHILYTIDDYEENKVKSNYVKVEANNGEEVKRVLYKVDIRKYKKYEKIYVYHYIAFYINSLFSEMNEAYRIIRDKKISKYSISTSIIYYNDYVYIILTNETKKLKQFVDVIDKTMNSRYIDKKLFPAFRNSLILDGAISDTIALNIANNIVGSYLRINELYYKDMEFYKKLNIKDAQKYINELDFSIKIIIDRIVNK